MKERAVRFVAIVSLFLGFLAPRVGAQTPKRGPSTAEERARAVKVAHALEDDPLAKDAKEGRAWVMRWIEEIPDITVTDCPYYFGQSASPARGHAKEIAQQMIISSAAFMIEHPEKAKDDQAVALSGLLGALKTYQAILKQDAASRWGHMDKLIQMREQSKLDDFVAETRRKCVQDEEEEDPNTMHAQAF
jgi:hypothetical protein